MGFFIHGAPLFSSPFTPSCSLAPMSSSNSMDHSLLGFSVHGIFPGKNTGVGCHSLLQGIFPTQGLNPRLLDLLHWQAGSLPLVPTGKPSKELESSYISVSSLHASGS